MATKNRPVIIQYPGQTDTYEVASPAVAKKVHPDAKIIGFAGTFEPYSEDPEDLPPRQPLSGEPPASVNDTTAGEKR